MPFSLVLKYIGNHICTNLSCTFSKLVKTAPTIIVRDGKMLVEAMKRVRVTDDEVLTAVRQHGHGSLDAIDVVILETDGSLSVIASEKAGNRSAYGTLCGPEH
jgi:uncharacterized membrane protein YcaP (DUF421 family)